MQNSPYQIEEKEGVTVFSIIGKMNNSFSEKIDDLISKKQNLIVFNLSQAKYLLGDHIEALGNAHNKCNETGGKAYICHVKKDLAYVLQIMELDTFFNIAETEGEAIQKLKGEEKGSKTEEEELEEEFINLKEKEERVKQFVLLVAQDIVGLRVLTQFAGGHMDKVTPKEVAQKLKLPIKDVVDSCLRFIGFRILKLVDNTKLTFHTSEKAHEDIAEFMLMWSDPTNYSKIMLWLESKS